MTSIRSPKPLDLKFQPSRWLCGYFIALHGIVAVSLWLVLPSIFVIALLMLLLVSAAYYVLRDVYFCTQKSVGRLAFADNHWRIYQGDNRVTSAPTAQRVERLDATVLPFGLVLRFKLANGRALSVPILPDQLSSDHYRRLRQLANFARAT
ncbi:MAG: hypothetical protein ACJAU3_000285 [Zhongshania sp.]|jgi:hypothetical protein